MDDEITSFRQSMTRERYFIRQKAKEANVGHSSGDIPVHLSDAICKPNGGKTMVQLRLELLSVKKTVLAFETDSAAQFIERYFQKHYANQPQAYGKSPADFVLKATGLAEYIYGSYPFHQFEFIRECIVKNKPIDLSLIALDQVQTVGQSGQQAADDGSLEDESFLIDDPHLKYDHAEISVSNENRGWDQMACISVFDLESRPFRFKLIGVDNVSPGLASWQTATGKASSCDDVPFYMYTTVALCCGDELIEGYTSELVPSSSHPRFAEWCNFAIRMANLPRDVRMCFTLWLAKKREINKELDTPLGWVNFQVFDYKHELHTGVQSLNMWPDDKANPIGTTVQNADGQNPSTLYIDFEQFTLPVVFPTEPMQFSPFPVPSTMESHDANALQRIWNTDPLYRLTQRDKHLLWKYREFCKTQPKALPKFLQAVPKANRFAVQEMYRLMAIWAPMSPLDALELLDAKYADAKIREYAVNRIDDLPNDDVVDYLLQLVQVLKYEPYHDTALARFLLRRALNSKIIGHHFFWFLKSEIHVQEISERFGLLLEAYLRGCGSHRQQLATQDAFQQKFVHTANHIKGFGTSDRLNVLRDELGKLQFPSTGISLPLNPRIEVTGLKVDKCKYMDSKKLPLWLVFKNADPKGSDPYVIFKSGDDLRQDMLTLQLIRIMDKLWKQNGMDLKLNPYGCISTGNEVGMIEVVLNSMTTASITRTAGGATAAFREGLFSRHSSTQLASHL
jgi:phosphatidylinositol-4,5-bisphosphate 3-kinase